MIGHPETFFKDLTLCYLAELLKQFLFSNFMSGISGTPNKNKLAKYDVEQLFPSIVFSIVNK